MVKSKSLCHLWVHCTELAPSVQSHMALDLYKLQGQVRETCMMGQTSAISFIFSFRWYSWIYYNDTNVQLPNQKVVLGRYLGPTKPELGSVLTAKILSATGEVICRTELELNLEQKGESLVRRGGRSPSGHTIEEPELSPSLAVSVTNPEYEVLMMMKQSRCRYQRSTTLLERQSMIQKAGYITAEVLLPKGDEYKVGKVIQRKAEDNGNPIGKSHDNQILDTREYEVEFSDGDVLEYAANIIAENLYSSVMRLVLMDSIINHKKKESEMKNNDSFIESKLKRVRRMTTKGWKFCVQWKDSSTSWECLKELKESNPAQVAK
jgi:hypothetical protein